jgi:hypothetical protein
VTIVNSHNNRILIETHLREEVERAQRDCLAATRATPPDEEKQRAMARLEGAVRRLADCITGGIIPAICIPRGAWRKSATGEPDTPPFT